MFKVGDKVECIAAFNKLVLGAIYTVKTLPMTPDDPESTIRLEEVSGPWYQKRFKLADEQPEQAKQESSPKGKTTNETGNPPESSPQGKTTIEVGSPIVVNYVKGQYNVVNYKTTVLKNVESFIYGGPVYTFKAPGEEHGNPVPSEIWSLTAPHVVLDTEDKPFAIGDKVLIIKEWQPFDGNDPTVGQIGIIRNATNDGRARIHAPAIDTTFWYEPGDFVHYTEGMPVPKEVKPRKIINPRKEV